MPTQNMHIPPMPAPEPMGRPGAMPSALPGPAPIPPMGGRPMPLKKMPIAERVTSIMARNKRLKLPRPPAIAR
jgi:hypothetical protein